MTNVAFEEIFFDTLHESAQCWMVTLEKCLQTKMPTFDCIFVVFAMPAAPVL